jgi:hypothetical protein
VLTRIMTRVKGREREAKTSKEVLHRFRNLNILFCKRNMRLKWIYLNVKSCLMLISKWSYFFRKIISRSELFSKQTQSFIKFQFCLNLEIILQQQGLCLFAVILESHFSCYEASYELSLLHSY